MILYLKKITLIIIILFLFKLLYSENWILTLLNEIPYNEINNLEFIHNTDNLLLNDSLITFYDNGKHYIFNIYTYQTSVFGEKGKGPGEFINPSNLIEINDRRYCIDKGKNSIMTFNNNNIFRDEKRIQNTSDNITNISNKYICTSTIPLDSKDSLLIFYDLDGNFLKKKCPIINKILGYHTFPKLSFIYSYSQLNYFDGNIFLIFHWLPCMIKYSIEQKNVDLIDFEDQLSFQPSRPVLDIDKNNIFVAGVYYQQLIENNKKYLLFFAQNRESLKRKAENFYLFKINKINYSLEFVKLFFKGKKIKLSNKNEIIVSEQKLFFFAEEDEKLNIYKINRK